METYISTAARAPGREIEMKWSKKARNETGMKVQFSVTVLGATNRNKYLGSVEKRMKKSFSDHY